MKHNLTYLPLHLLFSFLTHQEKCVPTGLSRQQFVLLSKTNKHCSKVDTVQGLWYFCSTCNKQVACRNGRPFTLARWKDHQESPEHQDHVRRSREVACLELKMKASDGKLTYLEQQTLGQLSKKQSPMQRFLVQLYQRRKNAGLPSRRH